MLYVGAGKANGLTHSRIGKTVGGANAGRVRLQYPTVRADDDDDVVTKLSPVLELDKRVEPSSVSARIFAIDVRC